MWTIVFILSSVSYTLSRKVDYCFSEIEPYRNFGVKTPYRFASSGKFERVFIPNCEPAQIWMLARHGTRYPQHGATKRLLELPRIRLKILESHGEGKTRLCDEDVGRIQQWSPDPHLHSNYASHLSEEGLREGEAIGRRLKHAYPELFPTSISQINAPDYLFQSIAADRTSSSLKAVINGIFGEGSDISLTPSPKENWLLQPNNYCDRWLGAIRTPAIPRDAFIRGPEYAEVQRNVSRRLGFDVTPATIHNMQDMCRFETAWARNAVSPWCAVFSKAEWDIIEYIDDIQYYYYSGYGVALNTLIGCFPAEDLIHRFRKVEQSMAQGGLKAIFYATTSRVLMDFFTVVGIAEDRQHLLATNYAQMKNRKWRTSVIAPFFGNLIATFYKCKESQPSKITFHLNEKLVMYPGCEQGICDWSYLENKLGNKAYECAKNCSINGVDWPSASRPSSNFPRPPVVQISPPQLSPSQLLPSQLSPPQPTDQICLIIISSLILMMIFHRPLGRIYQRLMRYQWYRNRRI